MRKKYLWAGILLGVMFGHKALGVELKQKFKVEVGVFDAASLEIEYRNFDNKYVAGTVVETENFFGSIYPFSAMYEARAIEDNGKIKSVIYMAKTVSRNHTRIKKIFYDDKGTAYKRVSYKDDNQSQKEIKDVPLNADTADLESVVIELLKNFLKNKSCKIEREIYDGKKHYRVMIKDEGVENRWFEALKKNENAYKCSAYIKNLKNNNDNILWDISAEKPINFWFDGKNGQILEINIDKTPLGEVKVYPVF